ncbi:MULTISPECIES: adenylate/guanylate cyclase domain-containing protein [Cyanophyceae]|uniref:adenylate/guanylate cyclase domain-containing protein n=1 Tax=Cyanophyceae TaxID=3028117 RepID=UPI00168496DE|nr:MULTISPECIES: adenylate/guanylate cyclase domain-containing protein [Cyanophyceae]MBD1917738.1 response regulator [Phormidium sp. FACHB-77]MBD2032857.1 response regulator [Phormidium sp. FACHB-322]MBD2051604.1 response regulator [Leptolyngbya sp. FACHB-60]
MITAEPHANQDVDILLVDDIPDNLRVLSTILEIEGYRCRKAISGALALNAIAIAPPDLILLDITMPTMDGFAVCRHLKADPATQNIPVIFLTARDAEAEKEQAFQLGAADYIVKPFMAYEVLLRVKHQLALRRQQLMLEAQNQQLQAEIKERLLAEAELRRQRQRSEELLTNVLPFQIAQRLKEREQAIADQFDGVTILFADIVDFSTVAAKLTPCELVQLLNRMFSRFDELASLHKLEKIKTIGDAYMVAAGVPTPRPDHAQAIARMALDMQMTIRDFCRPDGRPFELRIGINSGSVVAGVIGIRKFIYDLWGDTVNIASFMETTGEAGKIQVSELTYSHLKDQFTLEPRGPIRLKSGDSMTTYWLVKQDQDISCGPPVVALEYPTSSALCCG